MTFYNQIYVHAGWMEFARLYPVKFRNFRSWIGIGHYMREEIQDFMKTYDMGGEL